MQDALLGLALAVQEDHASGCVMQHGQARLPRKVPKGLLVAGLSALAEVIQRSAAHSIQTQSKAKVY